MSPKLQEFTGKGTTDGQFRKQRFFYCAPDSAVFVAVNKLRICTKPKLFIGGDQSPSSNTALFPESAVNHSPVEHEVTLNDRSLSPPPLEIGTQEPAAHINIHLVLYLFPLLSVLCKIAVTLLSQLKMLETCRFGLLCVHVHVSPMKCICVFLGERVVWIGDQGPHVGTVHWIGILPDSREQEWTVGVEFVSRVLL